MKRVAVFGLGYVGCVTAACLSRDGHRVIGVDVDEEKAAAVRGGRSPVTEPGLEELLASQVAAGRLTATTDTGDALRESDIGLVVVGTPSLPAGGIDTRALETVAGQIGRGLRGTDRTFTVAVRSTLLPGLIEERFQPILESESGESIGRRIRLCNHPEFLREAAAIRDYGQPPFILVGAPVAAWADDVLELYAAIDAPRIVTDMRTAAMVKYACNSYHAVKVAFANEIGALSGQLGADGQEVMRIACLDTQLNVSPAYLRPAFAFGGSCLPKDIRALAAFANAEGVQAELLSAILPSNASHLTRAMAAIAATGRRRVGLVGLSFKAGTDDLRESPQVILAESLVRDGFDLRIYDPHVRVTGLVGRNRAYIDEHLPHLARLLVHDPEELLRHAELLVLATNVAGDVAWQGRFDGRIIDLRRDLVVPATRDGRPT